ncbi:rhomboid-like protease 5 [Cyclospora cayetanensis]|uniref:Rhomboid-like protease n=1 Tax=Cyclospora cayetanensis TaxID=88456 RepID=A0A6P6RSB9_9EIME|nr:rhomboid-like protease 5 [Cyclospora cayetanensis]
MQGHSESSQAQEEAVKGQESAWMAHEGAPERLSGASYPRHRPVSESSSPSMAGDVLAAEELKEGACLKSSYLEGAGAGEASATARHPRLLLQEKSRQKKPPEGKAGRHGSIPVASLTATNSPSRDRISQASQVGPIRSQQVQPVLLTPEGARAFAQLEEGRPHVDCLSRRSTGAMLRSLGSSTRRRLGAQLKLGCFRYLLLCLSSAVLFFVFLQELIFNFTSFNGRCIGPVLYPPWTDPIHSLKPTLIPFGYGACEANLGYRNTGVRAPAASAVSPEGSSASNPGSVPKPLLQQRRCAWGRCAEDSGWPTELVRGGDREATKPSSDSPNARILSPLGALDTNLIRNYGEVYRIFWASALHGGWVHLLVNILCQASVLCILEPVWGFWRCLVTWIVSAMSGNLLSAVFDPCSVTVGSSGALYGLLGGLVPFAIENWDYLRYPCCVLAVVVAVIVMAQLTNLGGFSAVDNFAHLGGCLGGLLVGFATIYSLRPLRKFSFPVWWAKVRLTYCRCCLSEQTRQRLRERLQVVSLVYLWFCLLDPNYYETLTTPGRISLVGSMGCHCCRIPSLSNLGPNSVLSRIPAHHSIRVSPGQFWCFVKKLHADFHCGKLFLDGSIVLPPLPTSGTPAQQYILP